MKKQNTTKDTQPPTTPPTAKGVLTAMIEAIDRTVVHPLLRKQKDGDISLGVPGELILNPCLAQASLMVQANALVDLMQQKEKDHHALHEAREHTQEDCRASAVEYEADAKVLHGIREKIRKLDDVIAVLIKMEYPDLKADAAYLCEGFELAYIPCSNPTTEVDDSGDRLPRRIVVEFIRGFPA